MSAQFTYYNQYTNVNSALFSIDPYTSGYLDLQVTQNLLYGFGSAVNGRNIRVQKNNIKVTNLQFQAAGGHHGVLGSEPVLGLGGVLGGRPRAAA